MCAYAKSLFFLLEISVIFLTLQTSHCGRGLVALLFIFVCVCVCVRARACVRACARVCVCVISSNVFFSLCQRLVYNL